jgi:UPF0716 family protein affecting phage T7 exclusion
VNADGNRAILWSQTQKIGCKQHLDIRSNLELKEERMPYQPYLAPVVALIAGILILIQPGLLSIIVAVYLIVIGLLGLMGARPSSWWGR